MYHFRQKTQHYITAVMLSATQAEINLVKTAEKAYCPLDQA